ncbi:MAG: hypothetical protein AB1611_00685 [bacterium]
MIPDNETGKLNSKKANALKSWLTTGLIVVLISLTNASAALSQWGYPGSGFSFGSPVFSLNPLAGNYSSAGLFSPFSGSWSRAWGNSTAYTWRAPAFSSGFSLTPAYSLPVITLPRWQWSLPVTPVIPVTTVVPLPQWPQVGEKPAPAPDRLEGEWQSQQTTSGAEGSAPGKGALILDADNDRQVIEIKDSPLLLDRGTVTRFQYTPALGKAPISFTAEFPSGHTAELSGEAENLLCPRGVSCAFAGSFEVEGSYIITDDLGREAERGTFKLTVPVPVSKPDPKPDTEAIRELGKPDTEASRILSLTGGPDGRIYGGTNISSPRGARMFVYDPAADTITDLGTLDYECAAMTTGTNGLIYIGGGNRLISTGETAGYANFAIYDPAGEWNPGSSPESNPRDFGRVISFAGDARGRPIMIKDLVTAQDGKIYGCTGWQYAAPGESYACLFSYDPATEKFEYLGQPVSNQNSIDCLAIAADGILYGLVLPAPVNAYKRPAGKIFSFDPADKSFTIIDPKPADEGALGLTIGKDGLVYAAGTGDMNRIFSYDPNSDSFDSKGFLGGSTEVLDMICADNGTIYLGSAVSGYFIRYNPQDPWTANPYDRSQDRPEANPRMFQSTGKVCSLTEGQDGNIYFGTLSGTLLVYTGEDQPQVPRSQEQ